MFDERYMTSSPLWALFALLYGAVAFLPQNIIGIITDKYPKLNIGLIGSGKYSFIPNRVMGYGTFV